MSTSDPITSAMHRALEEGVFPGAVVAIRRGGEVVYHRAFGLATRIPQPEPASLETIYDLASLTKPLATTGALLCLVQEGALSLDQRLDQLLGELEGRPVGAATVFHLLNHSAGLPAWRPLYRSIAARDADQPGFLGSPGAKQAVLHEIGREALASPVGVRSLYSDLGFMLLGVVVERVSGRTLNEFCRERLYAVCEAKPLDFIAMGSNAGDEPGDGSLPWRLMAATEDDPWRGRVLRGEAHDENAFAMGGVAGHAGLFGAAAAVLAVSSLWLKGYLGRGTLFLPELVRRFASRQNRAGDSSWALGWDTPSLPSSSGTRLSRRSFGHLGYTGTSLWVDPMQELEVVLLSNRVHPTRENNKIREFRPVIHDLIYEEFVGD